MLFLAPALCAFALVIAWPFVRALGYAFTRFDLQTPEPIYVGLANFRTILQSWTRSAPVFSTTIVSMRRQSTGSA